MIFNGDPQTPAWHAVTAYCAPGLRGYAVTLLAMRGEQYGKLIEHPYMAGRTDVILTTDPDWPGTLAAAGEGGEPVL